MSSIENPIPKSRPQRPKTAPSLKLTLVFFFLQFFSCPASVLGNETGAELITLREAVRYEGT